MNRLKAMVTQARNNIDKRSKTSHALHDALNTIEHEIKVLGYRKEEVNKLLTKLNAPKATLTKPLDIPDGYKPYVYFDTYGSEFHYMNEETTDIICCDWPFDQEYVYAEDMAELGIGVV